LRLLFQDEFHCAFDVHKAPRWSAILSQSSSAYVSKTRDNESGGFQRVGGVLISNLKLRSLIVCCESDTTRRGLVMGDLFAR